MLFSCVWTQLEWIYGLWQRWSHVKVNNHMHSMHSALNVTYRFFLSLILIYNRFTYIKYALYNSNGGEQNLDHLWYKSFLESCSLHAVVCVISSCSKSNYCSKQNHERFLWWVTRRCYLENIQIIFRFPL